MENAEMSAEMSAVDSRAPFKTYLCRYYHRGSWWSLDIMAEDAADAEARVAKLGNLQLQGELKARIPATMGAGTLVRVICSIRNALKSKWPATKIPH